VPDQALLLQASQHRERPGNGGGLPHRLKQAGTRVRDGLSAT
jgi:hypothetical protein